MVTKNKFFSFPARLTPHRVPVLFLFNDLLQEVFLSSVLNSLGIYRLPDLQTRRRIFFIITYI